ncbi:MAG: tyrosine-type recombinase/integrase [Candidatus Acidiferrales bacterium]
MASARITTFFPDLLEENQFPSVLGSMDTVSIAECFETNYELWANGGFVDLGPDYVIDLDSDCDIVPPATAEQRRRGKSMSRRSGQLGTIVKEGGWYRVRFRIDVPEQHRRKQMSVKICPTSGPELLTKTERQRRKVEILNSFGANSKEHFDKVIAIEMGLTFREQAKKWLHQCMTRKRKPVKPATVRGWECYLDNHLNPLIGNTTLPYVNNGTLKMLGEKMSSAGLSPTTIRDVAKVMRWVKASAVDENGEQLYPTKWNYEFADIPEIGNQRTPIFAGEEITRIVAEAQKQDRVILALFPASGLRAGELFGLEVKHFVGDTITVAQSVWEGRVQTPKTVNAFRQVDLHSTVAAMLRDFIGGRREGFIFRTRTGTPFFQSNFLRSSLHPILEKLGIEKQGFTGFRRFRVTHLESSSVPPALVKYWTGHAKSSDGEVVRQTVTDRYIKMAKDTKFRGDVAERIGLGFELPNTGTVEVVPSVPDAQEMEVAVTI